MWDMAPDEQQAMIAVSVEQFLEGELPLERLRPNAPSVDRSGIHRAMAELGWFGIGIPESAGGMGLGVAEEVLVQRGCGRHLVSPSVLGSVIAAHVAHAAGDVPLLGQLIAGERRAALGIATRGSSALVEILALDWQDGDLLLTWNDKGAGLFEPDSMRNVQSLPSLDDSLSVASGVLDDAQSVHWVSADQVPIGERANLLLAAGLTGLADGACALATNYAKQREQFGKPIGSFQAIKHRCADMVLRAETSGHLMILAALKLAAGTPDASQLVAMAKLKAADAARENGRAVIQIHGGLGFQAECDAHWFMKRANVYDQAGGNMHAQARRIFTAPAPLW